MTGGLSRIDVHLDNCSHSSGKHRAYVAGPVKWHSACYKYSIVERFESLAHVSAWLTAWARYAATRSPADFSKEQHKAYVPSEEEWRALVPRMQEAQNLSAA